MVNILIIMMKKCVLSSYGSLDQADFPSVARGCERQDQGTDMKNRTVHQQGCASLQACKKNTRNSNFQILPK
jgi:hypothetical protein